MPPITTSPTSKTNETQQSQRPELQAGDREVSLDKLTFGRLFGNGRGRQPGADAPDRIEPSRLERARELVTWLNDPELDDWNEESRAKQILYARSLGFGIEYCRLTRADGTVPWGDEAPSMFLTLYENETGVVVGLVEFTLGGASLLLYDRPYPRRVSAD